MKDQKQERAYAAGARIARERMRAEAPEDADALDAVNASDVVVVPGAYDHVEQVLDLLRLPYTRIHAHQLAQARLRPEQLVIVNCPGHLDAVGLRRINSFVRDGGSLFTTDWALRHVIEPGFPGVLAYNNQATRDDVVRIEVLAHDNPFLKGVMDEQDEPLWWLEGSSYPIRVLEPERVQVLLASKELAGKYGEAPVAVQFKEGAGEVFHMISHYYLQRTELRTARDAAPSAVWAAEKGVRVEADLEGLSVAEVESAHASARFVGNIIARKKVAGPRPAGARPR